MRLLGAHCSAELGKVASGSATQSFWLRDRTVGSFIYSFRCRFGRERRASRLPCLSLGLGNDRRSASRSGDVNLAIFITSVSGSECLASFTNRCFLLSRPPGFRMAFDAAERNGRFGRNQCQRSEESNSKRKRKRRVFLCGRTVGVKVGGKVNPASFLKVERRGRSLG